MEQQLRDILTRTGAAWLVFNGSTSGRIVVVS